MTLLFVVLLGCPGPRGGGVVVASGVQQLAPAPDLVRYTRVNLAGPIELPDVTIEERWSAPSLAGERITYDVTTVDVTEGERVLEQVRHFYGAEGYGFLGTLGEDGTLEEWSPPQIVLPPDPAIGLHWEGTHTKGASTSVRVCDILASDYCNGGLVVVCESRRDGGVVALRDHFCPGVGWGGFEALFQGGNNPTVRMWSDDFARNGEPIVFEPPPAKQADEAPPAPEPSEPEAVEETP